MDRITELLAKGVENLTPEELSELDAALQAEADRILDQEGGVSDEDLVTLNEIAEGVRSVGAEHQRREQAEADRVAERDRLAAAIRGEQPEGEADEPAAQADEPAAGDAPADEAAPAAEPEPVTAGGTPQVTPARPVSVPRPASAAPRRTPTPGGGLALVASANVPGVQAGSKITDPGQLFAAFDAAVNLAMTASGDFKLPVAFARAQYPNERLLTMDAESNAEKLAAVTSLPALTASGGICAPVPYRYDLPTVGETGRPVRDQALAKFGVQGTRGGIKTFIPPTIEDVDGVDGPVSIWTEANDQSPASPTTKPYMTITCFNTESSTRVYAIPMSFKIGNFRDVWFPENVKAITDLAQVWQARLAESKLLKTIADGSKVVTHGQLLGSAQDVFTAFRQLIAGIRYRHRISDAQRFRVVGFEWVRDNIIADLIRKGPGDATLEERLRMAYSQLDAFFAAVNVNITWSPDFEYGKTIGQNGGPLAGTQGVGPVIGYPSQARFYIWMEGSWLFLDGGELNLGVIRDSTLVGTNDFLTFSETFENAHYHGVPGESYVFDIDICANGGIASALDIAPCVSGS